MEINKNIFREYDIRGEFGTYIDANLAYLIGKAFATKLLELGKTKTLVGYDNRKSSVEIEASLVKGIVESGVDVVRLGLVTTPIYYYGWDLLNIKCGIMVTASHNPKNDNGFKFSYNGIHNAYGDSSLELYNIIINNSFKNNGLIGKITNENIIDNYIDMITKDINLGNKKLKVVYDCGNGTTCIVANQIFDRFKDKLTLIPLFTESDPDFPNHHPDPAVLENLEKLKQKVIETKASLGVAYDGDGDRIGIIDNNGCMIDIDKFMIIIWRNLIKTSVEKKTFYDVKCSLALKEELDKMGIENEFYRTGNSYAKMKSAEGNYPFSGELSGHVFFRDRFLGYDDGIYASLRLIEILSNSDLNLSEMLDGINKYYSTKEIKIPTNDDLKFKIVDQIKAYCLEKDYQILTIDGVKVFFKDGSALVRASNTGPNLTCRFEAKTNERLTIIKKEFEDLINRLNN